MVALKLLKELEKNSGANWLNEKKILCGHVSPNLCAQCSIMLILNLSESLAKSLVTKLNMAYCQF